MLVVGLSPPGAEAAKNVVLSGVGGVDLLDSSPVTEDDFSASCLVAEGLGGGAMLEEDTSSVTRSEVVAPLLGRLNPACAVRDVTPRGPIPSHALAARVAALVASGRY